MTEGEIDLPGANSERNKLGLRTDATSELAALLRSKRRSLQQVQSGLSKVLTLDPLTSVKDLVIVGEGPAAEEIFNR